MAENQTQVAGTKVAHQRVTPKPLIIKKRAIQKQRHSKDQYFKNAHDLSRYDRHTSAVNYRHFQINDEKAFLFEHIKKILHLNSSFIMLFSCLAVVFHTFVLVIYGLNLSFIPDIVIRFISAFCLASYACTMYLCIIWVILVYLMRKLVKKSCG